MMEARPRPGLLGSRYQTKTTWRRQGAHRGGKTNTAPTAFVPVRQENRRLAQHVCERNRLKLRLDKHGPGAKDISRAALDGSPGSLDRPSCFFRTGFGYIRSRGAGLRGMNQRYESASRRPTTRANRSHQRPTLRMTPPYTRCPYRVSCPKKSGASSFARTATKR